MENNGGDSTALLQPLSIAVPAAFPFSSFDTAHDNCRALALLLVLNRAVG
jgi:hypothetical protein